MPIQQCSVKGVKGWKWGKSGKCYPGKGGKAKAVKQSIAIRASSYVENVHRVRTSIVRTNPMKSDPTRTKMLRKRFEQDIGMRFITLKRAIIALIVEEDAFGLNLNRPFNQEQNDDRDSKTVFMVRLHWDNSRGSDPQAVDLPSGITLNKEQNDEQQTTTISRPRLHNRVHSRDVRFEDNGVSDVSSLNQKEQADGSLLRGTSSRFRSRDLVRGSDDDNDKSALNQRFAFQSTTEQVASFEEWIKEQLDDGLINPNDPYWETYVRQGYEKGAGRAFNDTYRARRALSGSAEQQAFFDGTREQFLQTAFGQTESIEKVKLLASRTLTDLKGVSGSVATRMSRILTNGLIQGMGPRAIARIMTRDLDIDKRRAQTIARTEIIRAHAEGQLDALEQMGVEEVGVMVEWSTAGDDRVCPLCQSLEGVVLKIKEARGILPRHPSCRCAFLPANVGEPKTRRVNFGEGTQEIGQTRSKAGIEKAIKTSVSRERKAGTLKEKLKRSPWRGADRASTIAKVRPKSILDTGIGITKVPLTSLFKTVEAEKIFFAAGRELTPAVRALSDIQLRSVFKELNEANLAAIKEGRRRIGTEPKWIAALRREKERRFGVVPKKVTPKPVKVKVLTTPTDISTFLQGSRYTDDVFVVKDPTVGFRVVKDSDNFFGDGVYVTVGDSADNEATKWYLDQYTREGRKSVAVVTAKIRTKKMHTFDLDKMGVSRSSQSIGIQLNGLIEVKGSNASSSVKSRYEKLRKNLAQKRGSSLKIKLQERVQMARQAFVDEGYDAIRIKQSKFTPKIGGDQIVVFDAKNVRVVRVPGVPKKITPKPVRVVTLKPVLKKRAVTQRGWEKSLSPAQREAFEDYTSNSSDLVYEEIRNCLSRKKGCSGKTLERIKEMKKALDTAPKFVGNVYRGIVLKNQRELNIFIAQIQKNRGLVDKSFLSTSQSESTASAFGSVGKESQRPVMFRIKSKGGADINNIAFEREQEVLFAPKTRFKLKKITVPKTKSGRVVVELEEI